MELYLIVGLLMAALLALILVRLACFYRNRRCPERSLWDGCVGYWAPSRGATGTVLIDLSGKNNHGRIVGQAAWNRVLKGSEIKTLYKKGLDSLLQSRRALVFDRTS